MAVGIDFTILDGQQALGILGGHAEEGGDQHPEQSAGAAGGNGGGHADDVAGADGGGKGGTQSAEARDLTFAPLFVLDHELQGLAQVSHLEEPDPEGQPHAAGDDQNDQRYAPDGAVNGF